MSKSKSSATALEQRSGESDRDFIRRVAPLGEQGMAAAVACFERSEDVGRKADFSARIDRAVVAAELSIVAAAVKRGSEPTDYAQVAESLGMSARNKVTYQGYGYSTWKQWFRINRTHSAAIRDDFISKHVAALGRSPEQLHDYVAWLESIVAGTEAEKNTVKAISDRAEAKRKQGEKLRAGAEKRKQDAERLEREQAKVAKLKSIEGCSVTPEEWKSYDDEMLQRIAAFALAKVAKRAAKKAAKKATASDADAGPAKREATVTA